VPQRLSRSKGGPIADHVIAWKRAIGAPWVQGTRGWHRVIPGESLREAWHNALDWFSRPEGAPLRAALKATHSFKLCLDRNVATDAGLWAWFEYGENDDVGADGLPVATYCTVYERPPGEGITAFMQRHLDEHKVVPTWATTSPSIAAWFNFDMICALADLWGDSRATIFGALPPSAPPVPTGGTEEADRIPTLPASVTDQSASPPSNQPSQARKVRGQGASAQRRGSSDTADRRPQPTSGDPSK